MSFGAADWAIKLPLGNTHHKIVLVVIAQHANEDDEAWPSVRRIAQLSAMSDRGVRYAIAALVAAGLMRLSGDTNHRHYHLQRYARGVARETAAPDAGGTEDKAPAPDADPPAPPADPSGTPCRRINQESIINPSGDADASAAHAKQAQEEKSEAANGKQEGKPRKPRAKPKRATRLREDWEPSADDIAAAEKHPTVDWRIEAQRFRNYWLAKGGKDAAKTNWARTWENWIINEARYARDRATRLPGRAAATGSAAKREMSPQELWAVRIQDFRATGFWLRSSWGPPPGSDGCRAPAALVEGS